MALTKENKQELISQYGKNATDTGSSQVQVAVLTRRINELTEHLKINKKDFSTRRGLMLMVGRRRRLLNYLRKNQTAEQYRDFIKQLGLRK